MRYTTINFHNVVSLRFDPPKKFSAFYSREIVATDADGHTIEFVVYADSAESLADTAEDGKLSVAYAEGRADEKREQADRWNRTLTSASAARSYAQREADEAGTL